MLRLRLLGFTLAAASGNVALDHQRVTLASLAQIFTQKPAGWLDMAGTAGQVPPWHTSIFIMRSNYETLHWCPEGPFTYGAVILSEAEVLRMTTIAWSH